MRVRRCSPDDLDDCDLLFSSLFRRLFCFSGREYLRRPEVKKALGDGVKVDTPNFCWRLPQMSSIRAHEEGLSVYRSGCNCSRQSCCRPRHSDEFLSKRFTEGEVMLKNSYLFLTILGEHHSMGERCPIICSVFLFLIFYIKVGEC